MKGKIIFNDDVILHTDFNTAWDQFKALVKNIDQHAPFTERTNRGKDCPWLTRDLKQMMHERDYQLRNAKLGNKPEHWSNYRRLRNQTTYAIRKAKPTMNDQSLWRMILIRRTFGVRLKNAIQLKIKSL
jgi:hypothetical protein